MMMSKDFERVFAHIDEKIAENHLRAVSGYTPHADHAYERAFVLATNVVLLGLRGVLNDILEKQDAEDDKL
jgi:hypothetical protein